MSLPTPRRLLVATLLSGLSLAATAQSAYTLTVLSKPAGANDWEYLPVSLDAQGVVRGGMQYAALPTFAAPGQACIICADLAKPVSWPAGTGASVAATVGSKYLMPFVSNDKGTLVGSYSKSYFKPQFLYSSNLSPALPVMTLAQAHFPSTMAMRQGTVDTPVPTARTGQASRVFLPAAMNNLDWVAGRDTATNLRDVAAVWRNGAVTQLDLGGFNESGARGINDAGMVVGYVARDQPPPNANGIAPDYFPAVWTNDRLSWVGDESLKTVQALGVNKAGQALLTNGQASYLLANGVLTPIVGSSSTSRVYALALNNQGTVVGCRREPGYHNVHFGFIWKNGVMTDLSAELAAKGVTLPAGVALGCPVAINDSGSILAFYQKTADNTVTWFRLNARP